jgi:protein phosphatase
MLVAVADGIGGASDGDLAGAIAIQVLTESIVDELVYREDRQLDRLLSTSNIEAMLRASTGMAHNAIKMETDGGGSTLTCALIVNGVAHLAHVGDSRAYLIDEQRKSIELLTRDHRLVYVWEAFGIVTPEQARHHPQRHVLDRWLGKIDQFDVDFMQLDPTSSGWLLLCTDGISDVLNQNEIYAIVDQSEQPEQACARLINAALAHNTHDDLAAVLVEIGR